MRKLKLELERERKKRTEIENTAAVLQERLDDSNERTDATEKRDNNNHKIWAEFRFPMVRLGRAICLSSGGLSCGS